MAILTDVKDAINKERTARRALARLLAKYATGTGARPNQMYHDLIVEIDMAEAEVNAAIEAAMERIN